MPGAPRLLFPSSPDEALLEMQRVGGSGGWPGILGSPPRSGGVLFGPNTPVALLVPAQLSSELADFGLPGPFALVGSGVTGAILFGPAGLMDGLLTDRGSESSEAASRALRCGAGWQGPSMWRVAGRDLPLGPGTQLVAVVNATPDSFYRGSRTDGPHALHPLLEEAVEEGAALIDIGGESTRPGAQRVAAGEQIRRVVPIIEEAIRRTGLPVSIDTTDAATARAAMDAGAVIINDTSAGTEDPELLPLAAEWGAGVVLMHRSGTSSAMQEDPRYEDLVGEIHEFLSARADAARAAGIEADRIVLDPGLGFGKRRQHNFELYRRMAEFHSLGYPLLAGPSRKRHTSGPGDRPASERLMGTAAACTLLAWQGVQFLRVHDVGAVRRVLETADEIRGAIVEDRVS